MSIMEFPFNIDFCLSNEITLVTANDLVCDHGTPNNGKKVHEQRSQIIDAMGQASAKAQQLHACVTSDLKLKNSSHKVYLLKGKSENSSIVIGFIKIGYKRLFLMNIYGELQECDPLCVLDFYVHESQQRNGYGKKLFDFAIKSEGKLPHQVAIDRPSQKFLNFLSKHFALKNPLYQINKFVVFEKFFADADAIRVVERRKSAPIRQNLYLHDQPASRNVSSASSLSSRMSRRQRHTFKPSPLALNNNTFLPLHQNVSSLTSSNKQMNRIENLLSSTSMSTPSQVPNTNSKPSLLNPQKYIKGIPLIQTQNDMQRNYSRHTSRAPPLPLNESKDNLRPSKHEKQTLSNIITVTGASGSDAENSLPSIDSPQVVNHMGDERKTSPTTVSTTYKNIHVGKEDIPQKANNKQSEANYIVDNLVRGIADSKQRLGTSWNVFGVPSSLSYQKNHTTMKR